MQVILIKDLKRKGSFGEVIDVANGYSERFVAFVRNFRKHYPEIVIIAGNVVTG